MQINRNNFYIASQGEWTPVAMPTRKPDYVSRYRGKPSSQYYFSKEGVLRISDHWGTVASCIWPLKNSPDQLDAPVAGFCRWEDLQWREIKQPELMVEVINRFKKLPDAMSEIKKQLR